MLLLISVGIVTVIIYIHRQYNPAIVMHTEISGVDDETYESIGGLEVVKYPEQENFKQLIFSLNVIYSNKIEDIQINMPYSFIELLSREIYWTGSGWEFPDPNKRHVQHHYKVIMYIGEITKEDIENLLDKGYVTVSWKLNGEEKSKEYNIGESIIFLK
ncbi:hypothetical protein AAGS61_10095 [Lysinibacillus sp. KU-BSD001]|uniref:hypothetical protein n=1 Tax=Lysinibacillus sp. KU-BSD001 TaxID=3141328 RepID=UPI0036E4453D